jgi:hypothetical protein
MTRNSLIVIITAFVILECAIILSISYVSRPPYQEADVTFCNILAKNTAERFNKGFPRIDTFLGDRVQSTVLNECLVIKAYRND